MIRHPVVAGRFFPARAEELQAGVAGYLAAAAPVAVRPKALIVPHAGYLFSGPVAAAAYVALSHVRDVVRRVVWLGTAHGPQVHAGCPVFAAGAGLYV